MGDSPQQNPVPSDAQATASGSSGGSVWTAVAGNLPDDITNLSHLVGADSHTRVMSPNAQASTQVQVFGNTDDQFRQSMQIQPRRVTHVVGFAFLCPVCTKEVIEPPLCTMCGQWGHPECFGFQFYEGFGFCRACILDGEREVQRYRSFLEEAQ